MEGKNKILEWVKEKDFCFIPVSVKDKKPLVAWREFQKRKPTKKEIEKWENNLQFDGIGILCGRFSKEECSLEAIDLDNPELLRFFKDLNTRVHKTPGGGYHLLFYSKTENQRITKYKGFDLDLLGKGGYFIFGEGYTVYRDSPILKVNNTKELLEEKLPKVTYKKEPFQMKKDDKDFYRRLEDFKRKIDFSAVLTYYGITPKKVGKNYMALCPFHADTSPSLLINQDNCYCFSCNKCWDAIALAMEKENLDFFDSIKKIEEICGIKYERPKDESLPLKSDFLSEQLDYLEIARKYCEIYPLLYDQSKIWWIWRPKEKYYNICDETDILLSLNKISGSNAVINQKVKSQLLESLKVVGRNKHKEVKFPKKTWVQFKNVIVDIETGEKITPEPEYFLTSRIPWELGENEETPIIDQLFESWDPILLGKKNKRILYEIIAYCMLDDYPIHRLFALFGRGRNGKGTFIRLLQKFLGEENCVSSDLSRLLSSRFETSKLYKKKLCILGETDYKEMEKSDILKGLTGQDFIPAEFKGKPNFDFQNTAKLIIGTNNMPPSPDKTLGFYSRWINVRFERIFEKSRDVLKDVPDYEFENLAKKCVRILKEILEQGSFTGEGTHKDKEKDFEDLSNPLKAFIEQFCEDNVEGYIYKFEFNDRFKHYCREKGFRVMSGREINKEMDNLGYFSKQRGEKKWWAFEGLNWKDAIEFGGKNYFSPKSEDKNRYGNNCNRSNRVPHSISHDGNLSGIPCYYCYNCYSQGLSTENTDKDTGNTDNLEPTHQQQYELLVKIIEQLKKDDNNTIENIKREWNKYSEVYILYDIYSFIEQLKREQIIYEPKPGIFDVI